MIDENILSAPVINVGDGKCIGFIDMADIVWFTVNLFNTPVDTDLSEFFLKSRRFNESRVTEVMEGCDRPMWRPYCVGRDFSLFFGLETLARTSQHRLAVIYQNKVVGVLTESMMIGFLYLNLDKMGEAKNTPVSDLVSHYFVMSINENEQVFKAFKMMMDHKVSGVAVVNNDGQVVDSISVRDLKGIGPEAEMFTRLWDPILEFKKKVRSKIPHCQTLPRAPICVLPNDTLETVIKLMETEAVHRVFVVKDYSTKRPVNAITQSDVLNFILPY